MFLKQKFLTNVCKHQCTKHQNIMSRCCGFFSDHDNFCRIHHADFYNSSSSIVRIVTRFVEADTDINLNFPCPAKCHIWHAKWKGYSRKQKMPFTGRCDRKSSLIRQHSSKNAPIDNTNHLIILVSWAGEDSYPKFIASGPDHKMSKFRKHSIEEMRKRSKMRKQRKKFARKRV